MSLLEAIGLLGLIIEAIRLGLDLAKKKTA